MPSNLLEAPPVSKRSGVKPPTAQCFSPTAKQAPNVGSPLRQPQFLPPSLAPESNLNTIHEFGVAMPEMENLRGADSSGWASGGKDVSGADLTDANMRGENLQGADLRKANLRRANLTDANLKDADLTGANLQGADLSKTNLRRANLTDADLKDANLTKANLESANLHRANLHRANLSKAELSGAHLTHAKLYGADLTGANLSGADLTASYLAQANLEGANLQGADLTHADLTTAKLKHADLTGAYRTDAALTGARPSDPFLKEKGHKRRTRHLVRTDLSGAKLLGVDLSNADLRERNLAGAVLVDADLSGADLTDADLRGAYLRGADLTGANLTGADLTGADLESGRYRAKAGEHRFRKEGSGYTGDLPGLFYFVDNKESGAAKVGITNKKRTKGRRLRHLRELGFEVVKTWERADGHLIKQLETQTLTYIRKTLELEPYLRKGDLGETGGWSETFNREGVSKKELIDWVELKLRELENEKASGISDNF